MISLRSLASVAVAAGLGLVLLAPAAQAAAPVPFTDANATGFIGFCDRSGNPITSGSITQKPAIWTAVSSVAAPSGFSSAKNAKATLYAFQPRQDVDPGEWSGSGLTAGSLFSSDGNPMTQATTIDPPLKDFTSSFPAKWQGLVQLRMYFTAPNHPAYNSTYPATVIRISGTHWSVVSGGSIACNLGKAVSAETLLLPPSAFKSSPAASKAPVASATAGAPSATASSGSTSSAHPSVSATSAKTAAAPSASAAKAGVSPSTSVVADAASTSSSSGTPYVIGLIVVLAAAGGGVFWWRRRSAHA